MKFLCSEVLIFPWPQKIQILLQQQLTSLKYRQYIEMSHSIKLNERRRRQISNQLSQTLMNLCCSISLDQSISMADKQFYKAISVQDLDVVMRFFKFHVPMILENLANYAKDEYNLIEKIVFEIVFKESDSLLHVDQILKNKQINSSVYDLMNFLMNSIKLFGVIQDYLNLILCNMFIGTGNTHEFIKCRQILENQLFKVMVYQNFPRLSNIYVVQKFLICSFSTLMRKHKTLPQAEKIIKFLSMTDLQYEEQRFNIRVQDIFKINSKDFIKSKTANPKITYQIQTEQPETSKKPDKKPHHKKQKVKYKNQNNPNRINMQHGLKYITNLKIVETQRKQCMIDQQWINRIKIRKERQSQRCLNNHVKLNK